MRLDHDYAIIMNSGEKRGRLHGGEDGGRAGGNVGDHWYKYRDGVIRNGLSVMTYNLVDCPLQELAALLVSPQVTKAISLLRSPVMFAAFERDAHYVVQHLLKQVMCCFSPKHSYTGQCHGQHHINVDHYFYKYSPGHSAWSDNYYNIEEYSGLTEQQKRLLLPPSIGRRPKVVEQ